MSLMRGMPGMGSGRKIILGLFAVIIMPALAPRVADQLFALYGEAAKILLFFLVVAIIMRAFVWYFRRPW